MLQKVSAEEENEEVNLWMIGGDILSDGSKYQSMAKV